MDKMFNKVGILKARPPPPCLADVLPIEATQILRKHRAKTAKIHKIGADQDTICSCVSRNMFCLWRTIGSAVERVPLTPAIIYCIVKVNVVTTTLFSTTMSIRLFLLKSKVTVIGLKIHRFSNTHRVDEMAASSNRFTVAPASYDPVTNRRMTPYIWFAGRKRTVPIEGIWGEAAIVANHVGVKSHLRHLTGMPL